MRKHKRDGYISSILKPFVLLCLGSLLSISLFANGSSLQQQRTNVLKHYVKHLGQGDINRITALFTPQATVVSSSGIADNPEHFYRTLLTKTIRLPDTQTKGKSYSQLINVFAPQLQQDQMVVLFNFRWINQQNKAVSAPFLDLVHFAPRSNKIDQLFVYSNLYKKDIMKQLSTK